MIARPWLIGAVLASAACGRPSPSPSPSPNPPPTRDAATPDVLGSASQLVTAVIDDWTATTATMRQWHRGSSGWVADGDAWPAVIGATGAAWGQGLHGDGAPSGRTGAIKREGDAKSPAGVFALRGTYGYADAPPAGTKLPYTPVDASWQCVDDPTSTHYTQVLDRRAVKVDWTSAEDMRRADALYTWVVDVAHNPTRVAAHGSCIFLHVWHGPSSTTVGCTAMAAPVLARVIATLDPARHPAFVLLPRIEYDALAPRWGLPAQ